MCEFRQHGGVGGKTIYASGILAVCKKNQTHAGGRTFEYVDADRAKELVAASAAKKRKRDEPRGTV